MDLQFLLLIIALTLLTFGSGYFSSSEVAFFSLSPMQIKAFRSSKNPRKKLIGELINRPRDLLVTIFILNTIVNILLQNVASNMFGSFAGWTLKVGVPLVITLVFGEIIPKNFGVENNQWLSYKVAPSINFFQNLISPFRKIVINITTPISRILFFYLHKAPPISKDELKHTLEASEKYGVLTSEESEYVRGYLNLQEVTVKEVMRPRSDILFYDVNDPITKLIYLFKDEECTRLPVCNKGLHDVMGIITAKKYFLNRDKIKSPKDLIPYLSKPFFVPESILAKAVLRKFSDLHMQFALVIDEYGSTVGLITSEDIAELVIGEIKDLRDIKMSYTRSGKNEIIAGGRLELNEFENIFDIELPNPNNMVTIGGWLMEHFGEIPNNGSKYETDDFLFHILAADPNRVRRVYIRKKLTLDEQD
ncbi:MAG: hemolysin family protein [Chlamydiota bacterium]|nr:hemolysin family protein [Chlamydiota bacterium]